MGMTIEMCNDIENYEENVIAGFNARKTIYLILAVLVGAGAMAFFYFVCKMNLNLAVYPMAIVVAPIILIGFYTKDGMTFGQYLKKSFSKQAFKPIPYQSTENQRRYQNAALKGYAVKEQSEENKQQEFNRTMKKMKRMVFLALSGFTMLIILIIVLIRIFL